MVLCVGLVEALRVDEAQSVQARVHRSRTVGLIWHQSIITITHPTIHLQTQSNINLDISACDSRGGFGKVRHHSLDFNLLM